MSERGLAAPVEEIYAERNAAALGFASVAAQLGWRAWLTYDDPDWPTLYVETPAGQVSWHLPAERVRGVWWLHLDEAPWDGHSSTERDWRLIALTRIGQPDAIKTQHGEGSTP